MQQETVRTAGVANYTTVSGPYNSSSKLHAALINVNDYTCDFPPLMCQEESTALKIDMAAGVTSVRQ